MIAILFEFTIMIEKEGWWKWLVILECVEVALVIALALVLRIRAPLELAYVAPITSQVAVAGVLYLAFRELPFVSSDLKRTVDHLLSLGLFALLISATVIGLSLARYYTNRMLDQWLFYMAILTVTYRSPSHQSHTDSNLDLALTHVVGHGARPPHPRRQLLNSSGSLLESPILPPVASTAGNSVYDEGDRARCSPGLCD